MALGTDSEVFFTKDGKPFPAIGLVGGTKKRPKKCGVGHVQEDNVMAEFNTPPATNRKQWMTVVPKMVETVRALAKRKGCDLLIEPSAMFEQELLTHRQAQEVGCEPDFNAWTLQENERIDPIHLGNMRTAGGHVHLSWRNPDRHPMYRIQVVRALDIYLGLPSVLLDHDQMRRNHYGQLGAFRPKKYGVEYRTLSNFWLKSPAYTQWVWDSTTYAMSNLRRVTDYISRGDLTLNRLNGMVLAGDEKGIKSLMKLFRVRMPPCPEKAE